MSMIKVVVLTAGSRPFLSFLRFQAHGEGTGYSHVHCHNSRGREGGKDAEVGSKNREKSRRWRGDRRGVENRSGLTFNHDSPASAS